MYCPNCGKEVGVGTNFCASCGTSLSGEVSGSSQDSVNDLLQKQIRFSELQKEQERIRRIMNGLSNEDGEGFKDIQDIWGEKLDDIEDELNKLG